MARAVNKDDVIMRACAGNDHVVTDHTQANTHQPPVKIARMEIPIYESTPLYTQFLL